MNTQTSEIDYNKIRSSKVEGTITYKRIKFKSSNEPLYGVLCG
ncbi:hypothetical protein [Escherichia phage FL23]